ncbi:MAG: hypothetical protein JSS62_03525 [Verrucomicrobia bacterium]|nr:hypothetical protein [Verrucomicrobiota bacterium]MBS0645067.1 hypothetical protein [Verrucomicrobiota bacterium]
MSEALQELLKLTQDVRSWTQQEFALATSVISTPVSVPPPSAATKVIAPIQPAVEVPIVLKQEELPSVTEEVLSFPLLRDWAKGLFTLCEPITPVICLGHHPLLVKLSSAITEKFLPSTCEAHLPPLNHPLLKLVLIPLPLLHQLPELKHLSHLKPHDIATPVLVLHPLDVYLHHPHEKRLLWNLIQKLPLFC